MLRLWSNFACRPASPFPLFVGASASANVADGIRAVALPLLAVEITRDPALVAGLGVAQSLPFLIAGLPAGVMADRVDRRRLLVVTNGIEGALFALVVASVLVGVVSVPLLYGIAFCLGSNETVRDTTMSTAVPALVPRSQLERANGRLVTVAFVGNQLVGPALGAGLFAVAVTTPFTLSATLVALAAALLVRLPSLNRSAPAVTAGEPGGEVGAPVGQRFTRFTREVMEGVSFLARHRVLRTIALLAVVLIFTDAAWFSILVLLITDELGLAQWSYGIILAVAAVGGAGGGWVAHRVIARVGAAVVLRGGLGVIGAAQITIGVTRSAIAATTALAIGNAGFALWLTAAASQRHALTPDRILGRVTAAWQTAALGAIPVGMLVGGLAADAYGLRAPFLAGAPLVLGAALLARPLTTRTIATAHAASEADPPND